MFIFGIEKNNNFGTTIDNEKMLQILIDNSIPA